MRTNTSRIDWREAQKRYIGDPTLSMERLAKELGCSSTAVSNVARKYNWTSLRALSLEKTAQKLPEKISDEQSTYRARKYNQGKMLSDAGVNAILSQQEKISPYVGVLTTELGHKLQTEALDLDKKGTDININIMTIDQFVVEMQKGIATEHGTTTDGVVVNDATTSH